MLAFGAGEAAGWPKSACWKLTRAAEAENLGAKPQYLGGVNWWLYQKQPSDWSALYATTASDLPALCRFCLGAKNNVARFPSGWPFFYLVITGWIFDISLCETSTSQSIKSTNQ